MISLFRIEATNTDPDLTDGLAARAADPLWYLARQWQVGEFRGEDAATPILIEAVIDTYSLTTAFVQADGQRHETEIDQVTRPLQAAVEAETATECLSLKDTLLSSLRLMDAFADHRLEDGLGAAFRAAYPVATGEFGDADDPVGAARLRLLARRGFDARALAADITQSGDARNVAALSQANDTLADRAVPLLVRWMDADAAFAHLRAEEAQPAWMDHRQEYAFGVKADLGNGEAVTFEAPGYNGGKLDWHHFDLTGTAKTFPAANRQHLDMLASPLRFAGQPAARFWEVEDGHVYFGDLAGGAADLSRAVLGAYAAVAGDDWFVLPARVPVGHVARVASLRVRDNFDDWTSIPSIAVADAATDADRVWRWFEHQDLTGVEQTRPPLLFVPPVLPDTTAGPKVEEVVFRRDEMANLAWAIERRHAGAYGKGLVAEQFVEKAPPVASTEGDWTFELGHEVPGHWFPLVPIRTSGSDPEILLRRGLLSHGSASTQQSAKGVLLLPGQPFLLEEAEVPTHGAEVSRAWRMARTPDGGRHLWMARRKRPAVGAMPHSTLSYDELSGWTPTLKKR